MINLTSQDLGHRAKALQSALLDNMPLITVLRELSSLADDVLGATAYFFAEQNNTNQVNATNKIDAATKALLKNRAGSIHSAVEKLPNRASKCKCGPLELPELPTVPRYSPWATVWPTFLLVSEL